MKNSILHITCLFLMVFQMQAQDQYTNGMQKAFELWGEGNNNEAAALFERITQAEPEKWHPAYYTANVLIVTSFDSISNSNRYENLEKAQLFIKEAHDRSADNSEILTLEGLLYTAYVAMDPQTYAMKYSQKIMELHTKAITLNPKNPRAQANKIEYEMGTARFFNQDLKPFCERLEKALHLYDEQQEEQPFDPSYGKERVEATIQNCSK